MPQEGWDKLPFGEAEGISIDKRAVKIAILDHPSNFCSLCKYHQGVIMFIELGGGHMIGYEE